VSVRQRIDQLAAEPPVSDLGYVADQRLVASALLGLQLLADEIDALRSGCATPQPTPEPTMAVTRAAPVAPAAPAAEIVALISDILAQLADLSDQTAHLTALVERVGDFPQLALLTDQIADLTDAVMGAAEEVGEDDGTEEKKKKKKKKGKKREHSLE
jgi:hypothetical protein